MVEVSIGYAGFVDDATKNNFLVGGAVRRQITPRLSIGPELVFMTDRGALRDRNVLLTGNVVFDAFAQGEPGARRITPFLVAGLGMFWGRDQTFTGPFWSNDPAFTGGGGVRVRVNDSLSAAAEYRIGWELHQRVSGTASVRW